MFSTESTVWTKAHRGAEYLTLAELLRSKTSSEVPAGVPDHALEVHASVTVSLLIQHVIKDKIGH